jgi:hypothetical protein
VAALFVPKCTHLTAKERAEMYVKCGSLAKAGEELVKAKDRAGLEKLRNAATGPQKIELERLIASLSKR